MIRDTYYLRGERSEHVQTTGRQTLLRQDAVSAGRISGGKRKNCAMV